MEEEKSVNTSTDYMLAGAVVIEAVLLFFLLTNKVSIVGYILPGIVAVVATVITYLSVRDFFAQIK